MAPPISQAPPPAAGSGDLLNLLDMSQPAVPSTAAQSTSGTAELMELLGGGMGGGGVGGGVGGGGMGGGGAGVGGLGALDSLLGQTTVPASAPVPAPVPASVPAPSQPARPAGPCEATSACCPYNVILSP